MVGKAVRCLPSRFVPARFKGPSPVNFGRINASAESLQNDLDYAVRIAIDYLRYMQLNGISIKNKVLLEIGPGINFGSVLILACHGARVMVSDRFLTPWDDEYHPRFYGLLRDWVSRNIPVADTSALDSLLSLNGYPEDAIRLHFTPLENLEGIEDGSVDVVFSNAVLEHVVSPQNSFQQLARITRASGYGFHQVDFRDHRDMKRPLEFLLMEDNKFAREFEKCHGECGNRWRHWEYLALFSRAGFEVLDFSPNMFADEDYLRSFMSRIRKTSSRHLAVSKDELRIVSGLISVRR
jgi:SAM-dependent methyltransferase